MRRPALRFSVGFAILVAILLGAPGQGSYHESSSGSYSSGSYSSGSYSGSDYSGGSYTGGSYSSGNYSGGSYTGGSDYSGGSYSSFDSASMSAAMQKCMDAAQALQGEITSFTNGQRAEMDALFAGMEQAYEDYLTTDRTDAELANFSAQKLVEAENFAKDQATKFRNYFKEQEAKMKDACPDAGNANSGDPNYSYSGSPQGGGDACAGHQEDMLEMQNLMMGRWMPRFLQFGLDFNADRIRFGKTNPVGDQWKAWGEGWQAKGVALFNELKANLEVFLAEKNLTACFQSVGGFEMLQQVPDFSQMGQSGAGQYAQGLPEWGDSSEYKGFEAEGRAAWEACAAEGKDEATCYGEVESSFKQKYKSAKNYGDFSGGCTSSYSAATGRVIVSGTNHAMEVVPEGQMIIDFSVRGQPAIEKLFPNGYVANQRVESTADGVALQYYDAEGNVVFSMFDSPLGVMNFHTTTGVDTMTVDLLDKFEVEKTDKGVTFKSGDFGGGLTVYSGSVEVRAGNELKIKGDATFFVDAPSSGGDTYSQEYSAAALGQKLGADVIVSKGESGVKADPVTYGDFNVAVESKGADKVEATVDSEKSEGKTVVLKFDRDVLDAQAVKVKVGDASEEGEAGEEVSEASSLADVLDPSDDSDEAEYYFVEDEKGPQVLVSVPHFSAKKILVEASEEVAKSTPGFGVGVVLLVAVALVVLLAVQRMRSRKALD